MPVTPQLEEFERMLLGLQSFDPNITELRPLQKEAFSNPSIIGSNQNVFVIGDTSSGKTMIPLLLFLKSYDEALRMGMPAPKMFFAVPYRALASQKGEEFRRQAGALGYELTVVVSTGEAAENDDDIRAGNVDIAVIIAEKIYRFLCLDESILNHYQYFVIDEVGLLNNEDRGCKIDFIFALVYQHWQKRFRRKEAFRILALGTPYYQWDSYIRNYDFLKVYKEGRPVDLKFLPVWYRNSRKTRYAYLPDPMNGTSAQKTVFIRTSEQYHCSIAGAVCDLARRRSGGTSVACPESGGKCERHLRSLPPETETVSAICAELCRWHLSNQHQILIFVNDRERVRKLAKELLIFLKDVLDPDGKLPCPEVCKRQFYSSIEATSYRMDEEDLWGILDEAHYQALYAGIAFHSAELPQQLRAWIEKHFSSGRMKIVCSTETLAFGVNSNVDAVIVADIYKNDNGESRMLTPNEFHNYAGRAGRKQQFCGYVYPILKSEGRDQPLTLARQKWLEEQKAAASAPETLFSHFYMNHREGKDSMLPFFLLTIMPTSSGMKIEEIRQSLAILPRPPEIGEEAVDRMCTETLKILREHNLIIRSGGLSNPTPSYMLTQKGTQLRGFILGISDYGTLENALNQAVKFLGGQGVLDRFALLDGLLDTYYMEETESSFFRRHNYSRETMNKIFSSFPNDLRERLYNSWSIHNGDNQRLVVLASLLDWGHSEQNRQIYERYHIPYPMIQKASRQVCYLLEICMSLLPSLYCEQPVDLSNVKESLKRMHISLYYGIDDEIYHDILRYFKEHQSYLYDTWSHVTVQNERILRSAVVCYRRFERLATLRKALPNGADILPSDHSALHGQVWNTGGHLLDTYFREKFGNLYYEDV